MAERVPIERQVAAVEALLSTGEMRTDDLKGTLVFLKWAEKNQDIIRAANNAEVMAMVQAVLANPAVLEVKKAFPGATVDLLRSRAGQTGEL